MSIEMSERAFNRDALQGAQMQQRLCLQDPSGYHSSLWSVSPRVLSLNLSVLTLWLFIPLLCDLSRISVCFALGSQRKHHGFGLGY